MAKRLHKCSACGHEQVSWAAECPECEEVGTLDVVVLNKSRRAGRKVFAPSAALTGLNDVSGQNLLRVDTGISELNRVLGGGLVPGSGVILAGEPGMGKTTLASEIVIALSRNHKVAYSSGEESLTQVKSRMIRLGASEGDPIALTGEVSVERICRTIEAENLDFLVIDSIQTTFSEEMSGPPGSTGQIRESAQQIMRTCKENEVSVLMVGQVIKNGDMAGPRMLEHLVDVVLVFEGDRSEQHRIVRALKNRYGSTDEIGVFSMTETGLEGIDDPSDLFLEGGGHLPGFAITSVIEGSRPLLCEIQALASPSDMPQPIRSARGIDPKRLQMLLAVLRTKAGMREIGSHEIYVNVSGAFKIDDPGCDLAICMAIASAVDDRPVKEKACVYGEVSLLGLVKPARQADRRAKEAERLGHIPMSPGSVQKVSDLILSGLDKQE